MKDSTGMKYEPQIRRYSQSHTFPTREDREDFEQDARLEIWQGEIETASGAYTVLRRLYWREMKDWDVQPVVISIEPWMDQAVPDYPGCPNPEMAAIIQDSLDKLPETEIEALVVELIMIMGHSSVDVAELLEVGVDVIDRTLERLRRRLEG